MYRLDQIQTNVVRKLQEERKDDKVHRNKETVISDKKEKKENDLKKKQAQKKRYYTIDGVKYSNEKIIVEAEKKEDINSSGIFIDSKK